MKNNTLDTKNNKKRAARNFIYTKCDCGLKERTLLEDYSIHLYADNKISLDRQCPCCLREMVIFCEFSPNFLTTKADFYKEKVDVINKERSRQND